MLNMYTIEAKTGNSIFYRRMSRSEDAADHLMHHWPSIGFPVLPQHAGTVVQYQIGDTCVSVSLDRF